MYTAKTMLIGFTLISFWSVFLVIKDNLVLHELDLWHESSWIYFFNAFVDYRILFGTTLAIFSVYWSIMTYTESRKQEERKEESELNLFYAQIVNPKVSDLILELKNYNIQYSHEFSENTNSGEFSQKNPQMFNNTIMMLTQNQTVTKLNLEVLTNLHFFAYQIVTNKSKFHNVRKMYSESYTKRLEMLYPVIAVSIEAGDDTHAYRYVLDLYDYWVER